MFDLNRKHKGVINQNNQKDRGSCMDNFFILQTCIQTHTLELRSLLPVTEEIEEEEKSLSLF